MSFFVLGLLEFDVHSKSKEAFEYAKLLSKQSLSHGYSTQMHYCFEDPFYRHVLDPARKVYEREQSNTIEFELSDSPLQNSFDYGIAEFFDEIILKQQRTNLGTWLEELWSFPFVKRIVFAFSYGPSTFDALEKRETSVDGMVKHLTAFYQKGMGDQQTLYVLTK